MFHFTPTGIGSVPSLDVSSTCLQILGHCREVPFWPQFVRRTNLEAMVIQFSEGFPLLEISEDGKSLVLSSREREPELVSFYDRFLAEDVEHFAISRDYAPGLFELVDLIQRNPGTYGPYVKGQTVGPVTFLGAVEGHDGKSLLHDPELQEALVKGLAIRALWQVRKLSTTGKKPILFLDEPYLSGYGSAFTPIERHDVISLIKEVMDYLREREDVLLGIHCCGNTDWSMIFEAGPDILSFDAFSHMDYFLLYPEAISRFIDRGGIMSWGIIPTGEHAGKEPAEALVSRIAETLDKFEKRGLDRKQVAGRSLLTPSCGMGTMNEREALKALELLGTVSKRCMDLV
jgi:methionine synthase II (cobalamin-independent)